MSIEGNCDPRATEKYNIALGKKRADAAKKYLVGLGVDGVLLETFVMGKTCQAVKKTMNHAGHRREE